MGNLIKLVQKETERKLALDFSKNSTVRKADISTEYVYDGEGFSDKVSYHYTKALGTPNISDLLITDWSDYTHICVAIYSEILTNTTFQLRINTKSKDAQSNSERKYVILTVDWTGWKEFKIDISNMNTTRNTDMSTVYSISIDNSGTWYDLNFSENNSLYIGSIYLAKVEETVYTPEGISLDDPAVYKKAKDQWREMLVGCLDEKAEHGEEYNARIARVSAVCKRSYDNFKEKGYTFGNVVNSETAPVDGGTKVVAIYGYILDMALGYGTVGSDYYKNAELASDIEKLLEHCYTYYYGLNILEPDKHEELLKWSIGIAGNWWHRDIGVSLHMSKILLIMEDYLGAEKVAKYFSPFDKLNPYPKMTMANRLWIGQGVLASALLQNDAERILKCRKYLNMIFEYVGRGDGFYRDGSFIQHEKVPYAGGYGLALISIIADMVSIFKDTLLAYCDKESEMQYDWLFKSYLPLNYKGRMFASVRGREVTRPSNEITSNISIVTSMIKMSTYAPSGLKEKLLSAIRYNMLNSDNDYESRVPLYLLEYTMSIRNDDSIIPEGYENSKVYGAMDRIVQHTPNHCVCVSLNSTRTYKYEALNTENVRGWYQTDGAIHIYTDGYIYDSKFYLGSDSYKFPGTTVTDVERKEEQNTFITNSSPFVGGVECGKYALAVYEHGYDPKNKYYTSNIKANKSYFMFDKEIVAVGSGISDDSGDNVYTVIEDRVWRDGDKFSVNGKEISLDKEMTVKAKDMHFTNMGGYVFLEEADVKCNKNSNELSFLELWTEHGKNISDKKYVYAYLPNATVEETKAYSDNPEIEILAQSNTVHVVRKESLGITGYAFYATGEANGVKVSDRCALMIENKNGEYTVHISDPSHLASKLCITLELPVSDLVSVDKRAEVKLENGKTVITLSIQGNIGETYTVKLK